MTTVQVPTSEPDEQAQLDAVNRIVQAHVKAELQEESPNVLKAMDQAFNDLLTLGVIGETKELVK